jgi:hypothetical protein
MKIPKSPAITTLKVSHDSNLIVFTNQAGEKAIAPHWLVEDQTGVPHGALAIANLLEQIARKKATSIEIQNGAIQLITQTGKVPFTPLPESPAPAMGIS